MRHQAARLYDQAFTRKFSPIIKDPAKRIELIAAAIQPKLAIVAIQGERVVGVAGFHNGKTCFAGNWRFGALRNSLGTGPAIWAMALLCLFDDKPKNNELLIDAIAVDAVCRGQGIGGELLKHLDDVAKSEGLSSIRLEVIQGNDGAERLYKHHGYEVMEFRQEPLLKLVFDFQGYATMVKKL